ncbi:MAG: SDR family oxidoreductase [Halioglobus sp.]|nr:SDR family oxidoreductase [Halioglobus sp.]
MSVFQENVLAGRVALITGGGTGIGKEIARTLGRHGAAIAIASRKAEVIAQAAQELTAEGIKCLGLTCDVRDEKAVEATVDKVIAEFGGICLVVNNAAGNFPATLDNLTYNGFRTIVDIDLQGTYNVTKAVYDKALKGQGGTVINIAAPFEHWGVTYQAHVAAAKTGVISLTRTCAVEWANQGIRVNAVAPGFIAETEGVDRFSEVGDVNDRGLRGSKQDIANAVLFLASPAASFISGECIRVDGAACVDMLKVAPE